ncbi:MAG: hypothetical protein WA151_07125, partial [Desulfatirhabdiaceae bacterium]
VPTSPRGSAETSANRSAELDLYPIKKFKGMPVKTRKLMTIIFLFLIAFGLFACAGTSTQRTGTSAQQLDPIQRLIQKGITDEAAGNLGDAEKSFREAVNRSPLNWEAQWRLGVLLFNQNKIEESVQ